MTPISSRPPEPPAPSSGRALTVVRVLLLLACAAAGAWLYFTLGDRALHVDLFGARYELLEPRLLATAALVLLLPLGLLASLSDLPLGQRLTSAAIRAGLLLLLAVAIARPALTLDATRVSAVLLVDVSDSVGDGALVVPIISGGQFDSTCTVTVSYPYTLESASSMPTVIPANAGHGKIGQ